MIRKNLQWIFDITEHDDVSDVKVISTPWDRNTANDTANAPQLPKSLTKWHIQISNKGILISPF